MGRDTKEDRLKKERKKVLSFYICQIIFAIRGTKWKMGWDESVVVPDDSSGLKKMDREKILI